MPEDQSNPEVKFHPPEILSESGDGAVENASDSDWEKALHYHEIKNGLKEVRREKVRDAAIRAIIRKAQATMGSVSRPYELKALPWNQHPQDDFDLDSTLEEDPSLENLLVERKENRRTEVIVCVDTSLSMTGRKLALTAVSLAVLCLQLDPEDFSVVAFESTANLIKGLGTKQGPQEVLKKFMEVPARGLTNLEAGLLLAEKQALAGKLSKKAVILMTDGKFTAGKNPEYLIPRLPRLHVVQTGNAWSSPRFCRGLAKRGRGKYLRVAKIEHLPTALYTLVHEIIR